MSNDIVRDILLKTVDEFRSANERYGEHADKLLSGIELGKLKDSQWLTKLLKQECDIGAVTGEKSEDSAFGDTEL